MISASDAVRWRPQPTINHSSRTHSHHLTPAASLQPWARRRAPMHGRRRVGSDGDVADVASWAWQVRSVQRVLWPHRRRDGRVHAVGCARQAPSAVHHRRPPALERDAPRADGANTQSTCRSVTSCHREITPANCSKIGSDFSDASRCLVLHLGRRCGCCASMPPAHPREAAS